MVDLWKRICNIKTKFRTKYINRCNFVCSVFESVSMRTTLVDGRFLLLNPLLFWQFAHPARFSDRIHFHRYTLCIGRNLLRDVPHKENPW